MTNSRSEYVEALAEALRVAFAPARGRRGLLGRQDLTDPAAVLQTVQSIILNYKSPALQIDNLIRDIISQDDFVTADFEDIVDNCVDNSYIVSLIQTDGSFLSDGDTLEITDALKSAISQWRSFVKNPEQLKTPDLHGALATILDVNAEILKQPHMRTRLLGAFQTALGEEPTVDPSSTWQKRIAQERGENAAPPLPEKAPALWKDDKQHGDTPVTFIKRHYEPWLGKGLSRPDIKRLDPSLYTSIANWLKRNTFPDDFALPTKSEAINANLSDTPETTPEQVKEWWRRQGAKARRET